MKTLVESIFDDIYYNEEGKFFNDLIEIWNTKDIKNIVDILNDIIKKYNISPIPLRNVKKLKDDDLILYMQTKPYIDIKIGLKSHKYNYVHFIGKYCTTGKNIQNGIQYYQNDGKVYDLSILKHGYKDFLTHPYSRIQSHHVKYLID